MVKAINDAVVLIKMEKSTSEGGIYLNAKADNEVRLGRIVSIGEDDVLKEGMIVGYDAYDELKCRLEEEAIIVRKKKILFIWEDEK